MALKVKKRIPTPLTSHPDKLPQRTFKREQRKKSFRRLMTSVIALVLLAGTAGLAYTWYMGEYKIASADQAPPIRKVRPVFRPPKVASNAQIGVATQTITSNVKRGENASITIRSNPDATCTISVKYNKVPAVDSGLTSKVSDEFGMVSWAWTVTPTAPAGKWPVEVMCKNKKYSAVVVADLVVKP